MNRCALAALLAVLLVSAPVAAQDEDLANPAPRPAPRAATKPKTAPKAKGKGAKGAASKAAKAHAVKSDELRALDSALGDFLKEQKVQPLVLEEAEDDDALVAAMQTLDTSLDAQLKKSGKRPLTEEATSMSQGLSTIVDDLAAARERAPEAAPDAPDAPVSPDGPAIATLPRSGTGTPGGEPAAPPAKEPPGAPVPTTIASVADEPPAAGRSARFVLSRVTVSRDGGPERDVAVPSGGSIRPIPLAHRGGIPAVELKLVLKLPESIDLGESTQIAAQANIVAPGAVAELLLSDELVDSVRSTPEAGGVTAAGTVSYSFLKRVGGVFGYQQTFAQGDGRSTPTLPSRTLLLNWTDREASIELPFAWSASAPSAVSLRGRAIYSPAAHP